MERYNLVIQTAFLGDLALTVPLLKNLKRINPDSKLFLVCRKGFGDLLLRYKIVDKVFEITKKPASNWDNVYKELKEIQFNLIICPHQSMRSALFVKKLKAKEKISYKKWWNFPFFDIRIERPMQWSEVPRQMELIRKKDGAVDKALRNLDKMLVPELFSTALEPQRPNPEKKIFLAPGSEWTTKRWTVTGFIEVGKALRDMGFAVVVTGADGEKNLCAEIAAGINGVQDLSGKTNLIELYELYRSGSLLVSNDNGASHIAACAGLPVVSIFGPTVPGMGYAPWTKESRIAEVNLNCRPCSPHGTQTCPLGTHACMRELKPEKVLKLAKELIDSHARG